jgi:hypothetical protein
MIWEWIAFILGLHVADRAFTLCLTSWRPACLLPAAPARSPSMLFASNQEFPAHVA